jgi:glucan phosphorylase
MQIISPHEFYIENVGKTISGEACSPERYKNAYCEHFNMTMGAMITAGVDLWLNTPEPPM